jgi:hypothetical protein
MANAILKTNSRNDNEKELGQTKEVINNKNAEISGNDSEMIIVGPS